MRVLIYTCMVFGTCSSTCTLTTACTCNCLYFLHVYFTNVQIYLRIIILCVSISISYTVVQYTLYIVILVNIVYHFHTAPFEPLLSGGEIAGIVIGVPIGLIIIIVIAWFAGLNKCWENRQRNPHYKSLVACLSACKRSSVIRRNEARLQRITPVPAPVPIPPPASQTTNNPVSNMH